ncbi:MAG: TrmO family methyltransferase [Thermomicrobiales bacterium]
MRLIAVEGATLTVAGVDLLDGTPLLDIKPYVSAFDARDAERTGWYANVVDGAANVRADERFNR